mgnify:CR=1 FL=1
MKTKFVETVPMSTYLVAIVISDFKCKGTEVEIKTERKVNVSVCARPNAYNQLDLAYEASTKLSVFFENYYGIEYPLKKLDHAGVPQFKYGGKKNI